MIVDRRFAGIERSFYRADLSLIAYMYDRHTDKRQGGGTVVSYPFRRHLGIKIPFFSLGRFASAVNVIGQKRHLDRMLILVGIGGCPLFV